MMKRVVIILCMFCAAFSCCAVGELVPMPEGFQQVRIGMDWKTVLDVRPNAALADSMSSVNADVRPVRDIPKKELMETLAEGNAFGHVLYSFTNGILVGVMFGKEKTDLRMGKALIASVSKAMGMPAVVQLHGRRRDQGAITWTNQVSHVTMTMPLDGASSRIQVTTLQILEIGYARAIKAIGADTGSVSSVLQDQEIQRLSKLKDEVRSLVVAAGVRP